VTAGANESPAPLKKKFVSQIHSRTIYIHHLPFRSIDQPLYTVLDITCSFTTAHLQHVIHDRDLDALPLGRNCFETHDNNTECITCMFEERRKKIVQIHACNHVFHAQCLTAWVNAQIDYSEQVYSHGTCPTCRHIIYRNTSVQPTPSPTPEPAPPAFPAPAAPVPAAVPLHPEVLLNAAQAQRFARFNDVISGEMRELADLRRELRSSLPGADAGLERMRLVMDIETLNGVQQAFSDARRGLTSMELKARR
jgi:hypothetical protein